jgi:hypothetical protein
MAMPAHLFVLLAAGTTFATLASNAIAQDTPTETPTPLATSMSPDATFAFSKERWHSDQKIGWDGFLNGLRGFEHFYEPVGQPIYFESPFNTSGLRFIYINHQFSDGSQLQGGDLNVAALQVRVAITERLGFIATKDGYSWLDAGALPKEEGWNQLAAGLKYVIYADREEDLVITPGVRLMLVTGEDKVLQSDTEEISPFISIAKGWDRFRTIGNVTLRVPFDSDDGNTVLHWDLNAQYEIAPETLPGLAPMIELHGVHYLSDGDRLPLSVGGLDYTNLGSSDVSGNAVVWMGVGARWKLNPHMSIGAVYEFSLTDPDDDIMDRRVTADFQITW